MANERTTLTKSLHTITAVSRVAHYLLTSKTVTSPDPEDAMDKALSVALALVGQRTDWEPADETLAACRIKLGALIRKS